jgi:hypothetical protein
MYIHGYSADLSRGLNKTRAAMKEYLTASIATVANSIGVSLPAESNEENGLFIGTVPYTEKDGVTYYCDNYVSWTEKTLKSIETNRAHTHTSACKTRDYMFRLCSCDGGAFHHHTESCIGSDGSIACGKEEKHKLTCMVGYTTVTVTRDSYICGIAEHRHNNDCYDTTTYYMCMGHCGGHMTPQIDVAVDMSYESLAKLDDFQTTSWLGTSDFAVADGGAAYTVWSFIKDVDTIEDWQDVWMAKMQTWFSPWPHTTQAFIENLGSRLIYTTAGTVDSFTGWLSDKVMSIGTGSHKKSDSTDSTETVEETAAEATPDESSGFSGWYGDDEASQESLTIKPSILNDLKDTYGSWDEEGGAYVSGVTRWEELGSVTFPVGNGSGLSPAVINSIISQLAQEYATPAVAGQAADSITGTYYLTTMTAEEWAVREAVIRDALEHVGKYTYSLTGDGHYNGYAADSGKSECSGFVEGVLHRALGMTKIQSGGKTTHLNSYVAATWESLGDHDSVLSMNSDSANSTMLKPGDILAKSVQDAENYTGHVVIYLGYLPEGVSSSYTITSKKGNTSTQDKAGYYAVECTSTYRGSVVRIYNEEPLNKKYTGYTRLDKFTDLGGGVFKYGR